MQIASGIESGHSPSCTPIKVFHLNVHFDDSLSHERLIVVYQKRYACSAGEKMNLQELKSKKINELATIAKDLHIEGASNLRKQDRFCHSQRSD
jgi:hypothetical protein